MQTCPKCNETVQSDARYCEACGWDLSQPYPPVSETPAAKATPGNWIRERLAVVGGPIRQLRAKMPSRSKAQNDPRNPVQDAAPEKPVKRSRRIFNIIVALLTGAGIIAVWIWLLMRRTGERMVRGLFS